MIVHIVISHDGDIFISGVVQSFPQYGGIVRQPAAAQIFCHSHRYFIFIVFSAL